jgi:hypothetical protein
LISESSGVHIGISQKTLDLSYQQWKFTWIWDDFHPRKDFTYYLQFTVIIKQWDRYFHFRNYSSLQQLGFMVICEYIYSWMVYAPTSNPRSILVNPISLLR